MHSAETMHSAEKMHSAEQNAQCRTKYYSKAPLNRTPFGTDKNVQQNYGLKGLFFKEKV